jgi:hypothetical protein
MEKFSLQEKMVGSPGKRPQQFTAGAFFLLTNPHLK